MAKVQNWIQAIDVLIQGVVVAQQRGVYSLEDAAIIAESVEIMKAELNKLQAESEKKDLSVGAEAETTQGPN